MYAWPLLIFASKISVKVLKTILGHSSMPCSAKGGRERVIFQIFAKREKEKNKRERKKKLGRRLAKEAKFLILKWFSCNSKVSSLNPKLQKDAMMVLRYVYAS